MSGHTEAFEKQNAICDVSEVVAMDVAFMVVATYVSIVVDPAAGTHLLRSSRRRRKTKIRVRCSLEDPAHSCICHGAYMVACHEVPRDIVDRV